MTGAFAVDRIAIAMMAVSLSVYGLGVRRLWSRAARGAGISVWRAVACVAGVGALGVALHSPIDSLAAVLFSAHMTQHELLMLVAAPLIAMGRPGLAALWALSPNQRARVAGVLHALRPAWRAATNIVVVFILHALATWIWHVPALFDAAMTHEGVHALQHAAMLLTSVLFWWALAEGRYGTRGYGAGVVFVFATALHTGLLGAGLTFAPRVVYKSYATGTDPASALEDQQLAGLIMWIPSGVLFIVLGLALISAWLGAAERRARLGAGSAGVLLVVLAGLTSASAQSPQQTAAFVLYDGAITRDLENGITLARVEAETVAKLVGRQLIVARRSAEQSAREREASSVLIQVGPRSRLSPGEPRTVLWLRQLPSRMKECHFAIADPPATSPSKVMWDPSLDKFGAAQLNERYRRRFSTPMSSEAWLGWIAVKVAAESALTGDACAALETRRFDGHKGVPLVFDPHTRMFQQPLYSGAGSSKGGMHH